MERMRAPRRNSGWFVLAAVLGIAATSVRGTDPTWHLNAQLYSFHEHTRETELHNTTPGLGLIRRHDNWLQGVGIFRNSIGRWAGYGYVGWQAPITALPTGPLRLGAIGGITHRYEFNNGGLVPLGAIVATVPLSERFAIDLVGIPRIKHATYATLNVSLSWRFR
jgi:hypothetical protein